MKKHGSSEKQTSRRRPENDYNRNQVDSFPASPPNSVSVYGRKAPLIAPNTSFARAVVMGNEASSSQPNEKHKLSPSRTTASQQQSRRDGDRRPVSNLTALLNQQNQQQSPREATSDEADSASGPPPIVRGSSAPTERRTSIQSLSPGAPRRLRSRQHSAGAIDSGGPPVALRDNSLDDRVRRCLSSKELGTLAPPSGSPYAYMLFKKEELETSMRERLQALRGTVPENANWLSDEGSSTSSRRKEGTNEMRNRRRAEHNKAVVNDLCEVVAELFIAESKLLKPLSYGVPDHHSTDFHREQIVKSIQSFVSALPNRYALGADTPSEVLLHMRLMAAARSDKTKAAVHIHNLDDDGNWTRTVATASHKHHRLLRLVTIACTDCVGLLEYISRLLATGGSCVLDADVMLSTDGIVLDRFVVEMNGRLRLDKLANLIEEYLKDHIGASGDGQEEADSVKKSAPKPGSSTEPSGPLYYKKMEVPQNLAPRDICAEMETAVPLTELLASSGNANLMAPTIPKLRRMHSMPNPSVADPRLPAVRLAMRPDEYDGVPIPPSPERPQQAVKPKADGMLDSLRMEKRQSMREKRPLVNRQATSDLDQIGKAQVEKEHAVDYVNIQSSDSSSGVVVDKRSIPLIPFEELMLIETIGTGRVSTIYRAAWQRRSTESPGTASVSSVQMVALKVAMVNPVTGDTSHVDELRREADIAARLNHPNICDLVGVAADEECFCLAYEFCEGGSLLSLLSDSTRYYEYLPVALDVANGMAYLHSRNVIHRDLKASNILLTRDHRAKIADFGLSVAYTGQELTAETGSYKYMAPEVIRHESYSSNADVYSFGLVLWQLITREVPFATMTPIQAAYAVAEGNRPAIPAAVPRRLQEIITACWDQDSHKRPSFTYITMALADYAKMAFSPANVGALTLQIANEMLANVEGNSTVNVDFTTPVASTPPSYYVDTSPSGHYSTNSNVGLEIE